MNSSRTKITPPELARRWGISADKVLAWIRSGELKAIDAATKRGGRPRFLIDNSDIAEFEARRIARSVVRPIRRRRRGDTQTIQFF